MGYSARRGAGVTNAGANVRVEDGGRWFNSGCLVPIG